MYTYTAKIKFNEVEYPLTLKMKKAAAEHVGSEIGAVARLFQWFKEITGTLSYGENAGTSRESVYWSPFENFSDKMPDLEGWRKETAAWLGTLAAQVITVETWAQLRAKGEDIKRRYMAVIDKRESAEEVQERVEMIKANEAKAAQKRADFEAHFSDNGTRIPIPEGSRGIVLQACYDDSDSMTDYFHPHAQHGQDLLLDIVKDQRQTERIIRAAVNKFPELAALEWEWKDENYSMGRGYYLLNKTPSGETADLTTYGGHKTPPLHYCVSFAYGQRDKAMLAFRGYAEAHTITEPTNQNQGEGATLDDGITVNLEVERDWTWLTFSAKPCEAVRAALYAHGGRWSKRRGAWYFTRIVTLQDVGIGA